MSSDVVLTAALRNNLLSLQRTQGLIDKSQLHLATGLKVNSALDNPQSYFASQALKNRASDLGRLLDGIGQNIQVIKAADNGVTALTKLVQQADSIVQTAKDTLSQGTTEAKATGDRNVEGVADLTTVSGITNGDKLVIKVTDPTNGDTLIDFNTATTAQDNLTITINTSDSIDQLVTKINDNNNIPTPVVKAELDSKGQLQIKTLNGGDFSVDFQSAVLTPGQDDHLALADALGFGKVARFNGSGSGTNGVSFTASAESTLTSFQLYFDSAGTQRAVRSDLLFDTGTGAGLYDENGTQVFDGLSNTNAVTGDNFSIRVNGGTRLDINLAGMSIQKFIDTINADSKVNTKIRADFNDETSQITIQAIDPTVTDVTIGASADAATDDIDFGFGAQSFTNVAGTQIVNNLAATAGPTEETIRFGAAASKLADLQNQYNVVREQIDALVSNGDTGYRGTNLLNGDSMTTYFNEFRSSSLTTTGSTLNAAGLGLSAANFASAETVDAALDETSSALDAVRSFGGTLANDLAIIQTREDFTKDLISTLTEGSDKLTVADQN